MEKSNTSLHVNFLNGNIMEIQPLLLCKTIPNDIVHRIYKQTCYLKSINRILKEDIESYNLIYDLLEKTHSYLRVYKYSLTFLTYELMRFLKKPIDSTVELYLFHIINEGYCKYSQMNKIKELWVCMSPSQRKEFHNEITIDIDRYISWIVGNL